MLTDSLHIRDILNLQELKLLFEDFSTATGFTTGLIDPHSHELLINTGWRDICVAFHHTTPGTKNHCLAHNTPDLTKIDQPGQIHIRHCPNGLTDGFTPIIIEGHHLAILFTGQALFAPADKEFFRRQAQEYGFDEQQYLAALAQVPVVSEEKFQAMLRYLAKTVTLFAKTGLSDLQNHQEATKKESLLQSIFRASPTGINLAVDRKLYWANEKFAEITGYSVEELQGKNARLLYVDQKSYEEAGRRLYGSLEKYGTGAMDSKWRRKDGSVIDVYLSASKVDLQQLPGGVTFSVLDITARKKMEADKALLATAIDQAAETVLIHDTDGIIQYANPACERASGYTCNEALGLKICFLKNDKQDPQYNERMWDTLKQGKVWSSRVTNRKKDGSLFEENVTVSPVKNQQGEITNFVAVKSDVSKEVQLERQLRQAMKMEAIGILASGIAHDFNNILTSIIGYGQLAQMRLAADHPVSKNLNLVISAGNRAAQLVKQILAFSHQAEDDYHPIKLHLIVKEALQLLRASLPSTITINEDIATDCSPCFADPTQIHQVVMNLCTNAKLAIGTKDGSLSVALAEVEITNPEGMADSPLLEPGTYLDLTISDTGCGMDHLTLSKIFDPFFTTREKGEGTGLGLSVVHGIIKQCKGEITVTSEPGRGTTFHIYLPVQEGESLHNPPVPEAMIPGSERILLVDDEELIIDIHQLFLDNLGYHVTSTTSSLKALEIFKENPTAFDLVLTDMTMPDINGIELAREILKIRPDIPIILCTGHSESTNEKRAKALGIRKFLMKPVAITTLSEALRGALGKD